MKLAIVTLFPDMFRALTDHGVMGKAIDKGLLQLECINPRDFTSDKHRTVDDRPYGGGPGMLMKVEPLQAAIAAAKSAAGEQAKVVYLSPRGESLTNTASEAWSRPKTWSWCVAATKA